MLLLRSPGLSVASVRRVAQQAAPLAARRLGQQPLNSKGLNPEGTPGGIHISTSTWHHSMDRPELRERLAVRVAGQSKQAGTGEPHQPPPPPPLPSVLFAVAVVCVGSFAFGYHVGIVNGPLEVIAKDLGFAGNSALSGAVVSSTLAGAAVSSLTGGSLADNLGRKRAFFLACVPMLLGPLLCAWATDFTQLVAGRLVTGLAIGLSSALIPTYISEVSPTAHRGTLGSYNQLFICIGILGALCVNVLVPVTQWRSYFLLGAIPAVLLALGMLRAQESPRWMRRSEGVDKAKVVAAELWGDLSEKELAESTEIAGDASVGVIEMLRQPGVQRGMLLFAIQQFAGINALVYFSTSVFRQAGVTSDTLASLGVGLVNVLGTIISGRVVDKSGRKQLLIGSYVGQASSMFLIAAGFSLPVLRDAAPILAVGGTLLYILAFSLGAGPVTGLIIPELNDDRIRSRAVAAGMTSHWVCNVAVGQTFMAAVQQYGLSTVYTAFGTVALLGALYILKKVPETQGKSFKEIGEALAAIDAPPALKSGSQPGTP